MLVIYELFTNEDNKQDEVNIGDFDSLKEVKIFLKEKRYTDTSIGNISSAIKNNFIIHKKYKVFKYSEEEVL